MLVSFDPWNVTKCGLGVRGTVVEAELAHRVATRRGWRASELYTRAARAEFKRGNYFISTLVFTWLPCATLLEPIKTYDVRFCAVRCTVRAGFFVAFSTDVTFFRYDDIQV